MENNRDIFEQLPIAGSLMNDLLARRMEYLSDLEKAGEQALLRVSINLRPRGSAPRQ